MTQKEKVFSLLYINKGKFMPTWKFTGIHLIADTYELLSYKCPTRLTELFQEIKLDRQWVVNGKIRYYEYRLSVPYEELPLKYKNIIDKYKLNK